MKKISFEDYREEMPSWLADYSVGTVVDVDVIFKGNTLYWSEADAVDSGAPIRLLNVAHAAHLFVYASCRYCDGRHGGVDFRGYTLLDEQALDLERLLADTSEDYRPVVDGAWPKEAVLRIYERLPEFGEEHGALRFAFLELAGDSIDLYDRLFGGWTNGRSAPLLVGVGDYNGKTPFGKEYRDRCVLKGGADRMGRRMGDIFRIADVDDWHVSANYVCHGAPYATMDWLRAS